MTAHLLATLPGPVALVCGSGGLNAAAQAGMLQAFPDSWRPDLIVGASGGALTASCLAVSADAAAAAAQAAGAWQQIADSGLVQVGWSQLTASVAGRENSRRSKQWRALFESLFGQAWLAEDGSQALVSTNLTTGSAQVFTGGPIVSALLAAAAFPVLASAVEQDSSILVDGSFCASLPVLQALDLGAKSIVALDTGRAQIAGDPVPPRRWYDVVMASIRHQVAANAAHDVATAAAQVPVVMLAVADPFRVTWEQIPERIEAGARDAAHQLADLRGRWASIHDPGVYTAADDVRLDRRLTGLVH